MNLVPVKPEPVFHTTCCRCGGRFCSRPRPNSDDPQIFADTDGEPFKAYYCGPCAAAARPYGEVDFVQGLVDGLRRGVEKAQNATKKEER